MYFANPVASCQWIHNPTRQSALRSSSPCRPPDEKSATRFLHSDIICMHIVFPAHKYLFLIHARLVLVPDSMRIQGLT